MPRTFDNIDQCLLPAIEHTLGVSNRADFRVGYFNLRAWKHLDCYEDYSYVNDCPLKETACP